MTSFRFIAPEYYHRHKTADWYWAVSIIAIAATVTAIIFNNILFAILIVLSAFSLIMYASRRPDENEIEISDSGVTVGNYRFTFSTLESFWIEHTGNPRILIKTKRVIMPHVIIPVESLIEEEVEEIRVFLQTKINEMEQTEPLLEQIMEYIGF